MTDKILVLTNCGTEEEAGAIARDLVERRLAACVSIAQGVRSIYRWRGEIEEAREWTLLIKSTLALFEELSAKIQELHSYELPEVVAIPIGAGSETYLAWIASETLGPSNDREVADPDPSMV